MNTSQLPEGEVNRSPLAPSVVMAARELKDPLAVIRQLAFSMSMSEHPEQVVDKIILTSERALRLTSDITEHAQLQNSLFESEVCDAYVVCSEVVREISPLYAAHDRTIRIARKRHPRTPAVVANPDLLRRTLLAFSDNALRHTQTTNPVEFHVQYRQSSDRIRIMVRDFGSTMSTHFWREIKKASLAREEKSTILTRPLPSSLGLGIAMQFAHAMKATTGVIRHRDGTTFYIDMPTSGQMKLL